MRVAILGVGRMGRRHIHAVSRLGLDLAGVFDVKQESLKSAKEEHTLGTELLFDDLEKMYAVAKPECLIVATTADSHCTLACMAAEHGARYVLVEKPMAVSLNECDRMINTCDRLGARLAVNHQMRFMEVYTEPKRLAATEAFGGLASMTVIAGNVGFSMNGTHYFEAFHVVSGEAPVEVTAWFSPGFVQNPRGAQYQDRAGSIRAVTAGGRRFYMEIGADQGHGIQVVYACRNGTMMLNELTGELASTERRAEFRDLPTVRYGMPDVSSRRTIQPSEVIDSSAAVLKALLDGKNSVSGEDGRRVIELLVAAYQSAETGSAPVRVDGKLDRSRSFPWA